MYPRTLTISSVGQITLPKRIREFLGVNNGTKVTINVNEKTHSVTIKKPMTLEDVMAEMDRIDQEYPTKTDPEAKHKTVGEMSREGISDARGDSWV